jgi:hypothetical protein
VPPAKIQKAASLGLPISKQDELKGALQQVAGGSVVVVGPLTAAVHSASSVLLPLQINL